MTTMLRIPGADASEWDLETLNLKLERAADKAGGELIDDSESEGEWETFVRPSTRRGA